MRDGPIAAKLQEKLKFVWCQLADLLFGLLARRLSDHLEQF